MPGRACVGCKRLPLRMRAPLVLHVRVLTKVWSAFCGQDNSCTKKAAPPETAYMISLPQDWAKRKHMEQSLKELGLSVDVIGAIQSDQVQLSWGAALMHVRPC